MSHSASLFVLIGLFAAIGGGGCCTIRDHTSSPTTGSAPATREDNAVHKPFMIHEAALPERFPAPGPVGEVIVKRYPACREAVVESAAVANSGSDSMFYALFRHIKKNDIAMTAPVEMQYKDLSANSAATRPVAMAFLYRHPEWGHVGTDGTVRVVDAPPVTVISIGIRGTDSDAHLKEGMARLNAWLAENPGRYAVIGPPRLLGYNSPFVPWFLRFGELQLPVKPISEVTEREPMRQN